MTDRFSPLSEQEISVVPVTGGGGDTPADDGFALVVPIPEDHPPVPDHPSLGKPTKFWTFHNEDCEPLFFDCRFDPTGQKKVFIPLSLWGDADGKLEWRWKGVPAPRPLYNLHRLAAEPNAPVIVVEGEKCADAASKIFPDYVCVTSMNGGGAADKTDWTPLKKRHVMFWRDCDEAGEKYEHEVLDILARMGCTLGAIDAQALASMLPEGGTREAPTGWDAADALHEWEDLTALRDAVLALAKPIEKGPAYISFGDYTMDERGLWVDVTTGRGNNATVSTEWVSGPFEVLGATRDPHGREWGKWLRWLDSDGRVHLRHIADSALHGDSAALAASLANEGLRIDRARQRALASYLCGVQTDGRVTMVSRTGWHCIGGHDVFVLPHETVGPRGAETVILDAIANGPYEARGTFADWQAGVGVLVADHALGVLAVSAALAGPLLGLAGAEGGGIHLCGHSSFGKSTLQYAAASVWGRGISPGYIRAWRATANGLEGAAAASSDTALVLDEVGAIDPREMSAAVYGLANGVGKQRAARDGSLREPKSWRVMVISSGEVTVAQKIGEDRGKRVKAGQMIRILDIPADRGCGFGAFDNAGPDGDAAKLASAIRQAASTSYGTAGPEFVRRLVVEKVGNDDVRKMITEFVANEVPPGADGQVVRAAERLALIAAAGALATALGVVPWPAGAAHAAAKWAFEQWVTGRGGTDPHEARQAIETVRLVIEQHGGSRFEVVGDPDAKPVFNRLGWRKGEGDQREWWIPSEVWRADICAGQDASFVAKVLADRGMLRLQGGRGFQCKVNIGGDRRVNCYVLTSAIHDGDGDAS